MSEEPKKVTLDGIEWEVVDSRLTPPGKVILINREVVDEWLACGIEGWEWSPGRPRSLPSMTWARKANTSNPFVQVVV